VCNVRAREFNRHCLAGCAPLQGRELCYLIADRQLAECTSNGLPADECAADAADFLERCLNAPPASCDERCTIRSAIFNDLCQNNPNPPADVDCADEAAVFLSDCLLGCEPPNCVDLCGAAGRDAHRTCIAGGGTPPTCRAAAQAAIAACRADCAAEGE
jgi:hypothetical protein